MPRTQVIYSSGVDIREVVDKFRDYAIIADAHAVTTDDALVLSSDQLRIISRASAITARGRNVIAEAASGMVRDALGKVAPSIRRKPYREWRGKRLPDGARVYYDRHRRLRSYYGPRGSQMGFCPGVEPFTKPWWDGYLALRDGRPLPMPEVVEKGKVVPGSWAVLIAHFKEHNDGWKKMDADSTQRGYLPYMNRISEIIGPYKVAKTEPATIKEFISKVRFGDPNASDEKKRKPRPGAARMYYTIFGLLYEHACDPNGLAWVAVNPMRGKFIEKPKTLNKDGHHTLTEVEVEALRLAHPDYASDERAFLEIGMHWGPRAGDLMQLGFKNIEAGFVTFTPEKTKNSTGAEVALPVEGEHLLAVLAHRPKTGTFFFQQPPKGSNQWNRHKIVDLSPRCWDYTRARKTWKEMRERACIGEEAVIHSMRKCFATRMANAGASLTDIADALGDTEESAKIYVQKRNKRAGAARAVRLAAKVA
jgi:integrase